MWTETLWVSSAALPFVFGKNCARINELLPRHNIANFHQLKTIIHLTDWDWIPIRFDFLRKPIHEAIEIFLVDLSKGLWPQIFSRYPPMEVWLKNECRSYFVGRNGEMINRLDATCGVKFKMNNQYNVCSPHGFVPVTILNYNPKSSKLSDMVAKVNNTLSTRHRVREPHDKMPPHNCVLLFQPGTYNQKKGKKAPPQFPPPRKHPSTPLSTAEYNADGANVGASDSLDSGSATPKLSSHFPAIKNSNISPLNLSQSMISQPTPTFGYTSSDTFFQDKHGQSPPAQQFSGLSSPGELYGPSPSPFVYYPPPSPCGKTNPGFAFPNHHHPPSTNGTYGARRASFGYASVPRTPVPTTPAIPLSPMFFPNSTDAEVAYLRMELQKSNAQKENLWQELNAARGEIARLQAGGL